jgi:hypothetical protein
VLNIKDSSTWQTAPPPAPVRTTAPARSTLFLALGRAWCRGMVAEHKAQTAAVDAAAVI